MCDERPVLPLVDAPIGERADAARNRRRILDAANRLLDTSGPRGVTPDAVARAAGVGVGTVYRRFGDRGGLFVAMLDERERVFQAAFMSGPAPLGPGAPAAERIRAFLGALLDRIVDQSQVFLLAEKSGGSARFRVGPYGIYHTHLVTLLRDVVPVARVHYLADVLLAPLTPGLLDFQLNERGMSLEDIRVGLDFAAERICG